MPIIDKSYFKGELFIPNTVNVPDIQNNTPSSEDKLNLYIEKYEYQLLVNALGVEQYNDLIADQDEIVGKWYDLINGKEYNGVIWAGLKSLIPYFIYCNYLKYESVQFNTTGLERSLAKNSIPVFGTDRIVDFFNKFIGLYQGFSLECCCFWNTGTVNNTVSLLKYLSDFPDLYSISFFKTYQFQNNLGI